MAKEKRVDNSEMVFKIICYLCHDKNINSTMNIKILVAHHKPGLIISNDVYLPIHVGKSLSKENLGISGDNVGDNISERNSVYCEMTGAYWGWKNLEADYVGLCHYRRYFTFKPMPLKSRLKEKYHFYKKKIRKIIDPGCHYSYQEQTVVWDCDMFRNMVLDFSDKLKSKLEKGDYDIVVPRPYIESSQNLEQHFREIGMDHIKSLKDVVSRNYPSFYPYLIKTLNSHKLYAANMFVMKWDIFENYCKLVFDVLDLQMKSMVSSCWCINPLTEGCYYRVSGYLAEVLTSAYVLKIKDDGGNILFVNSVFLAT